MKPLSHSKRQDSLLALTVLETLLIVIVVGILLAMLVPINPRAKHPKKSKVRMEISDIANAIEAYHAEYGRYPVSTNIQTVALTSKDDFTYGGSELNQILGSGESTQANAELMAILMDATKYPDGRNTANSNHCLNPKAIKFLNAKLSGDTNSSGVGLDLVYRDFWGQPYIISMDLNGDGRCRDAFYKKQSVSRKVAATGYDGLTNFSNVVGTNDCFEFTGKVMVWSLGPDGKADKSQPSTTPPNKDNVVSWR
jgi:Tfp pilus assembly protein PilE